MKTNGTVPITLSMTTKPTIAGFVNVHLLLFQNSLFY